MTSILIRIDPTGYWREPLRAVPTGSLPPSPAPCAEAPRCTKPVRVWPSTHAKVKEYARRKGLEIAQVIGMAVDMLPRA